MKTLFKILIVLFMCSCSVHIRDNYVIDSVKMNTTSNGKWYEHKLEGSPVILDSKELYSPGDTVTFLIKPKNKLK